jgi:hypothetical protein
MDLELETAPALELGVLLTDRSRLAAALAHVVRPERTQIFLMDDGVLAAPELRALTDAGAEVALCAMDAEARGLPPLDGIRFGSQYDHARLVRDAGAFVSATRAGVAKHRPQALRRTVGVTITCEPEDPLCAQALRSAVAYVGCDLPVELRYSPRAASLLDDHHPPALLRHLATLRGLGVRFRALPGSPVEIEVTW